MKRNAADDLARMEVERLERSLVIAKASLDQLDVDASRVSLPRSSAADYGA